MSVHYTTNGISVSHAVCSAVHCTLYVLCSVHTEKFAYGAPYAFYVLSKVVCMPILCKTIKEGFTHCIPDGRIFLLLQDPDLTTPCTGPPSTKHTQQRDRARYDIFNEKIS